MGAKQASIFPVLEIGDTVHVVTIEHRHGLDTSVHATHDGACKRLYDWVNYEWDEEMRDAQGGVLARPKDPEEMVEMYFEYVDSETYYLDPVRMQE